MSEPTSVTAPDVVYRVARSSGPLNFSSITPQDAQLPKAGNRFDVPGGAVLYAATEVSACFAETVARFRPTLAMQQLLKGSANESFMKLGGIPQDWRLQRSIFELEMDDPQPFLDVEDPSTQAFLSAELAGDLIALGYEGPLDISTICNSDRRLSRLISNYAYTATDQEGRLVYSGIRYVSRVDPKWECWAIFDGTTVSVKSERAIAVNDPDLELVTKMWDLRPY